MLSPTTKTAGNERFLFFTARSFVRNGLIWQRCNAKGWGPCLKRAALVGMFVSANHRVIQPGAIGEDDMIQAADRIACLGGKDVNGDYVPGRHRGFGPADRPYGRRSSRFANPVRDATLVIFYVKVNQAV